ncbi:hypothetical protein GEOBRER4_n2810 [Citrifermentans bremense]|uniref:Uncharacterized protein n=1 Tax=Citrifermentans bremense TaxID=60035 RepID=A0A7R7FSD9_9BACT|nr:hypothetical protein GEOBRER4_n2810 [Citrifermentans bremense]
MRDRMREAKKTVEKVKTEKGRKGENLRQKSYAPSQLRCS